jgi:hypothetical protein
MHVPQSWLVLSIVGVASRLQPSAAHQVPHSGFLVAGDGGALLLCGCCVNGLASHVVPAQLTQRGK